LAFDFCTENFAVTPSPYVEIVDLTPNRPSLRLEEAYECIFNPPFVVFATRPPRAAAQE
jgi:hypothetical protein